MTEAVHFVVTEQLAKTLMSPLLLAITRSLNFVDQESSYHLLDVHSEIWALVDDFYISDGTKEGVDITLLGTALGIHVAKACSYVFSEDDQEMERAWSFIMAGYNIFQSSLRDYIDKTLSSVQENTDTTVDPSPDNRTLH